MLLMLAVASFFWHYICNVIVDSHWWWMPTNSECDRRRQMFLDRCWFVKFQWTHLSNCYVTYSWWESWLNH